MITKVSLENEAKRYILRFRQADQEVFVMIKDRRKRVETRAASSRYCNIKVGDTIEFVCAGERFSRQVKSAIIFPNAAAMLKRYKLSDINPKFKSKQELLDMYNSFPGYKEKLKRYGILALEFNFK